MKGNFAICPDRMNAVGYQDILEMNLPQFVEEVYERLGKEPICMQDNARVQTAKFVVHWLKGADYILMVWPPYSPDLNPIEHIWRELKICLQEKYPNIKYTKGGPDKIKAALAEALPQVWDSIPKEKFEALCTSIPDRVEAVIKARGWYTKY